MSAEKNSDSASIQAKPEQEFEDAMPSLDSFSTFLLTCDYTKWRDIADSLNMSRQTLTTISDNLQGDKLRDKKAFLRVLASWREKAPIKKPDRKANWRNLQKALANFSDILEAIDKVKQRWSENDDVNLCKCGKPSALRNTKDSAKSFFTICPKPHGSQCKGTYATANRLLYPKLSPKGEPVQDKHSTPPHIVTPELIPKSSQLSDTHSDPTLSKRKRTLTDGSTGSRKQIKTDDDHQASIGNYPKSSKTKHDPDSGKQKKIRKQKKVEKQKKVDPNMLNSLSCSSFSVSSAWNLKRLDSLKTLCNINLDGTGTVIVILDTAVHQHYMEKKIQVFDGLSRLSTVSLNHDTNYSPIPVFNCPDDMPVNLIEHGTVCSAIAVGSPPLSLRGVAPGATLMVYRVAEGNNFSDKAILEALKDIQYKMKYNLMQVDVISISCECDEDDEDRKRNLKSKIEELTEMGIAFVAAAGNRGSFQAHTSIPARFDSVISVGALDKHGDKARYTSKGKTDVYAPGEVDLTNGVDCGTSFAAPAVGGVILLLKQWAKHVGSPAKDHIHHVKILRKIFSNDMMVNPDNGGEPIFDPVEFFMNMKDNPTRLNEIVQAYLYEEFEAFSINSFLVSSAWKLNKLHSIRLDGTKLDGTGTVIVILDTAIDESIMGTEIEVIDYLPDLPRRSMGHGTVCSAVAVGSPILHDFPSGVAPGAKLIVCRIAEGGVSCNFAILKALQDIKERGVQVDIVSISYDCGEEGQQEIKRKIEELTEMGITFVAAVGNSAHYDGEGAITARFQGVISVGSLDKHGKESEFNSQGRTDVCAPGEDIEVNGEKIHGTSYATPALGGLVLLLKQWANYVGSPAKDYIHCAEILRKIFSKHMVMRAKNNKVDLFQPFEFFMNIKDDPAMLNWIVQKYIGTAGALKAFDKIVMQSSEFVNPNVFIDIIQKCGEDGIIESKKLSKSDQVEMKEILNTVLSEIRNSISMNGVGVFDKLIMIFQSADQQFLKLAEQMKSVYFSFITHIALLIFDKYVDQIRTCIEINISTFTEERIQRDILGNPTNTIVYHSYEVLKLIRANIVQNGTVILLKLIKELEKMEDSHELTIKLKDELKMYIPSL